MEPHVTIRAMDAQDAQAVATLVAQLGYERAAEQIAEWIAGLASEDRRQAAFVACLGAEVVGWVEASLERRLQCPPFALIGGLVVSHAVRNRGIGRLLCRRAETWAWEQGLEVLRVTSRSTRTDAHRFYLRDGYETVKTSLVFEKHRPR